MVQFRLTFLFLLVPYLGLASDEATQTLVRSGCPEEMGCCAFGKAKLKRAAPVYNSDDSIERIGTLKKGAEIEAEAGRIHTNPGKLKLLQDFDQWKSGTLIGLYSEPNKDRKTRIGVPPHVIETDAPFLVEKRECKPPSKECWAKVISHPGIQWWIKVKYDERRSGWVEAKYFERVGDCS